ncbi:MAG: MotA/TolQ/ExbB proton channel family protein [Verrucomicrobiota bacterium]
MKSIVKWPFICGSILFLSGPVFGLLGTVLGMIRVFEKLKSSAVVGTGALSSDISVSLVTTVIGIGMGFIGAALMLFSLIAFLITRNPDPSHRIMDATA